MCYLGSGQSSQPVFAGGLAREECWEPDQRLPGSGRQRTLALAGSGEVQRKLQRRADATGPHG